MAVTSVDEAIALANDTEYGLTASGWTRDPAVARLLQERLAAGAVTINDCVSSFGEPAAPWGGYKHSGVGRTHGLHGLREMVQVKFVTQEAGGRPAVWWYPYGEDYRRLMWASGRALYSPSPWRRLLGQMRLLSFPRFWRRVGLWSVVKNVDKLF
jgi:succinate-semialdehyde dehydrogenase/glutarate-semialdehyde dehydrogenase